MCAWKRGTQNNIAGPIRKGHIREFAQRIYKKDEISSVSKSFRVIDIASTYCTEEAFKGNTAYETSVAIIRGPTSTLPSNFMPFVLSYGGSHFIYLHAHEYPVSILMVLIDETNQFNIPSDSIALTQAMRINSKVCIGEFVVWSIYQEYYQQYRTLSYDCRSGAIGNTHLRRVDHATSNLSAIIISAVAYSDPQGKKESSFSYDGESLATEFKRFVLNNILTVDDQFVVTVSLPEGQEDIAIRVVEVRSSLFQPQTDEEDEELTAKEGDDGEVEDVEVTTQSLSALSDDFRGQVGANTAVYIFLPTNSSSKTPSTSSSSSRLQLVNCPTAPKERAAKDVVDIRTSDGESFPVKRRLLRPCISLTSLVQAGRGKYKFISDHQNHHKNSLSGQAEEVEAARTVVQVLDAYTARVPMDACTFDRVLLYLEHEARGEAFQFDPLLASELLEAAILLGISGLRAVCERVLGSFEDRVRRTPIRLQEVLSRNLAGAASEAGGRRGETLLVMDGMVLDISRWLDEHPGGSTIIPEQALGVDCTVFFEIYHASRQAYLYLKEFYIGELALEDRARVAAPARSALALGVGDSGGGASPAFMDQLQKMTSWRLDVNNMPQFEEYKSF